MCSLAGKWVYLKLADEMAANTTGAAIRDRNTTEGKPYTTVLVFFAPLSNFLLTTLSCNYLLALIAFMDFISSIISLFP